MAYRGPDPKVESLTAVESLSGGSVNILANNTSNTASSQATIKAQVAGSSADDAMLQVGIAGGQTYSIGLDNSASDALVISSGSVLGTNNAMSISSAGVATLNSPVLVTPELGTPASGTMTNVTGLPISTGVSGLGTGVATFLATPSSANLASAVTDETGTGGLVFANTPTLITPVLGAATGTSIGIGGALESGYSLSSKVTTNLNAFLGRYSADSTGPRIGFFKSRNASIDGQTIVQSGDSLGGLQFGGSNGTSQSFGALIESFVDGTPGASNDMPGRLSFYTTADGSGTITERLRINANGKIDIGSMASAGLNYQLNTVTDNTPAFLAQQTNATITGSNIISEFSFSGDNDATGGLFLRFTDSGGQIGSITAASATTVAYNTSSDERLKEDIKDFNGLAIVDQIMPKTFLWKEKSEKHEERREYGFIAQQLHTVLPTMVTVGGDDVTERPWSVDYGKLTGVLTQAIKELHAEVKTLKARVAELES